MAAEVTAPALAQALEELADDLPKVGLLRDGWYVQTLRAAAAALRAAVRPEPLQLRNRDTPEGAAFWDSIDAAVATWERTKPTWQRELDRAAVRGAETPDVGPQDEAAPTCDTCKSHNVNGPECAKRVIRPNVNGATHHGQSIRYIFGCTLYEPAPSPVGPVTPPQEALTGMDAWLRCARCKSADLLFDGFGYKCVACSAYNTSEQVKP